MDLVPIEQDTTCKKIKKVKWFLLSVFFFYGFVSLKWNQSVLKNKKQKQNKAGGPVDLEAISVKAHLSDFCGLNVT